MSAKRLGRGLSALLAQQEEKAPERGIFSVSIDDLVPNDRQPRKTIPEESLNELAESIKSQGVVQPLLVRPLTGRTGYQIIAGERRWRAARKAGLREVPVYACEMSDTDAMAAALIENLQREDLNPAEEAAALKELKDSLNLTQDELARRVGRSRPQIANALRLLQLPEKALTSLREGNISAGHARCLLALGTEKELQEAFLAYILEKKLSVRECEEIAAAWKKDGSMPWVKKPGKACAAKKNPALRSLEKQLSKSMSLKVRFSGTAEAGKLTFIYKNAAELARVLKELGVSLDTQA